MRKYVAAVTKANEDGEHQRAAWLQESRALVIRCLTSLNSKIQNGAPEAVSFLFDKPMLYKSHDIANVRFSPMLWHIERQFTSNAEPPSDDDEEKPEPGLPSDAEGAPTNTSHDTQPAAFDHGAGSQPCCDLWVDDSGKVVPLNPLHDYMYRPREIKLPLYLPFEQYHKKAAAFKRGNGKEKEKGARHFPKAAIRFSAEHPQYATHHLAQNQFLRVPWIQGPALARNPATDPERFGKLASCLFKTWWTWDELRNANESWDLTWQTHVHELASFDAASATPAEKYVHAVTLRVLQNSTAIHTGLETVSEERKARDIHRGAFKASKAGGWPGDDNPLQEAFRQYLHEAPLTLPSFRGSDVRSHQFAHEAVEAINKHCPAPPTRRAERAARSADAVPNTWTPHEWTKKQHRSTATTVRKQNDRVFQAMLDGKPPALDSAATHTASKSGMVNAPTPPPVIEPAATDFPTLAQVADTFTLNERQRHAFLAIGDTSLQEYNELTVPQVHREEVA
jgi:hypothetical protein